MTFQHQYSTLSINKPPRRKTVQPTQPEAMTGKNKLFSHTQKHTFSMEHFLLSNLPLFSRHINIIKSNIMHQICTHTYLGTGGCSEDCHQADISLHLYLRALQLFGVIKHKLLAGKTPPTIRPHLTALRRSRCRVSTCAVKKTLLISIVVLFSQTKYLNILKKQVESKRLSQPVCRNSFFLVFSSEINS